MERSFPPEMIVVDARAPRPVPRYEAMDIARTIAQRVNEIRLQQALEEAHRARLAFLRVDAFDGDCARCARKVCEAEERAARLEASLRATEAPLRATQAAGPAGVANQH
jgi:hypothetical protein